MICPICSKNSTPKFRPFCSKHCADVDLGRWLSNSYVLPDNDSDRDEHHESEESKKDHTQH